MSEVFSKLDKPLVFHEVHFLIVGVSYRTLEQLVQTTSYIPDGASHCVRVELLCFLHLMKDCSFI